MPSHNCPNRDGPISNASSFTGDMVSGYYTLSFTGCDLPSTSPVRLLTLSPLPGCITPGSSRPSLLPTSPSSSAAPLLWSYPPTTACTAMSTPPAPTLIHPYYSCLGSRARYSRLPFIGRSSVLHLYHNTHSHRHTPSSRCAETNALAPGGL